MFYSTGEVGRSGMGIINAVIETFFGNVWALDVNILDWHLFTVHNIQILAPSPHRINMRINKDIIKCCHYSFNSTSKNTCRIDHIIGIKSIQVFNEYLPPRILLLPLFLQFLEQFESHALTHSSSSFQRPCLRHPIPSHSCLQLLLHSTLHWSPKIQFSPKQTLGEGQPVTLPGLKLKKHVMKIFDIRAFPTWKLQKETSMTTSETSSKIILNYQKRTLYQPQHCIKLFWICWSLLEEYINYQCIITLLLAINILLLLEI